MERITGLLFSGFAVKAYAIGAAFYVASYVYSTFAPAIEAIKGAL